MQNWVLKIIMTMVLLAANIGATPAQTGPYPNKPVKLVVGFPPGTPPEVVGRLITERLAASLGQPFVIENRPGAAGTIAASAVAQAPADGYTLMLGVAAALAVAPHLLPSAKYDPRKDFAPIGLIQRGPYYVFVRNELPINSLQELIAYSKENPTQLNYASPGTGTVHHLTWELFMQRTGAKLLHVPFQGGAQMVMDTVAGRTQVFMDNASSAVMAHIKSGTLRMIGVTADRRSEQFPSIATGIEQGVPGFESYSWWGLVAPAGTPDAIVQRLNTEMAKALATPALVERLRAEGVPDDGRKTITPAQFGMWIASEFEGWGKVIKDANVKIQ
ncbi:MAG: Bug family tripartite tricarboxylate transporter substrate binding protein [Burkholderiales bacterium]